MSLYGALSSGVSGLSGQGTKISTISDNIANVNTVGYKQTISNFSTLVTSSATDTSFSNGGVLPSIRQDVDQQGLVESTGIITDLSIAGQGMFVVSDDSIDPDEYLYTRAGSFRTDERGNFVNAADYVLYGWPLDSEGRLPGEAGNTNTASSALLDSLEAININSLSGIAASTTEIELGLNLDASEDILQGPGDTIDIPTASTENSTNASDDIIHFSPSSGNTLVPGTDSLVIDADGQTFTFLYGGIEYSDNVTGGLFGSSLSNTTFSSALANGDSFSIEHGTSVVTTSTFTYNASSPNTSAGQFNSLDSLAAAIHAVVGLSARVTDNVLEISGTDANDALTFVRPGGALIPISSNDITANILGAATTTAVFTTGVTTGDGVRVEYDNAGTRAVATFTFDPTATAGVDGLFANLTQLAEEINSLTGVTSAIAGNTLGITAGTIYAVSDFNAVSNSNFASNLAIRGADLVAGLGLTDVAASTNRFSTLEGLYDLVNDQDGINAVIDSPLDSTTVSIFNDNPLGTIQFGGTLLGGSDALLNELGLASTQFESVYDASDSSKNIAGGFITADFSRNIRIFDSFGTGHDFQFSFVKLDDNIWSAELYAINPDEIVTSRTDGSVAFGTIVFNGDGTLRSVSEGLSGDFTIAWDNEAVDSTISLDLGTAGQAAGTAGATVIGLADGLRQFDSDYNVDFVEQNGVAAGLLSSVAVDEDGFVIANFSNGEARNIYKIPIVDFANVNGLTAITGNVYRESTNSGSFNLREAGESGVGTISPATVESSNVDLSTELTQMIIAQRSYQASSTVITTVDELLEELNRI
ncbi:MAG: flagellar hook-basal body complex protein [Pseudomonadota bacterium]